jgi:hypothetical protein
MLRSRASNQAVVPAGLGSAAYRPSGSAGRRGAQIIKALVFQSLFQDAPAAR